MSGATSRRAQEVRHGVSMICTLYNEAEGAGEFLDAVWAMDVLPEELVLLDGGSTDGTGAAISAYLAAHPSPMRARLIVDPECNRTRSPGAIALGRNRAIAAARHDVIAATDAGCRVAPGWLDRITAPFAGPAGPDVVAGWYVADARTAFERCVARVWLVPPEAVDPSRVLPSSRSIAFRRSAWERAGGYPEHTYTAEDTLFDLALRKAGCVVAWAPEAIVRWRMKPGFAAFARLVHGYGYGDGVNGIMGGNLAANVVKLSVTGLLAGAGALVHPLFFALLVAWWTALLARGRDLSPATLPSFLARFPLAVAVKLTADAAYVAGHLDGRRNRNRDGGAAPPASGASRP